VWLPVAGFTLLGVSFLQPRWGESWEEVRRQSRDIIVCVDTSESMNAKEGPLPPRIKRARQKIASLMERMPADRFALVAFSGAASLQCPLTVDHNYVNAVLEGIDTDVISLEGTNITAALEEAAEVFQDDSEAGAAESAQRRGIVLITDGEQVGPAYGASADNDREALQDAAATAAKLAELVVVGVGDPQGVEVTIPDYLSRHSRASAVPEAHVSRLDEQTLTDIAAAEGRRYIRMAPDESDVDMIQSRLEGLKGERSGSQTRAQLVNRYQWPLAAAIACFAAESVWLAALPRLRRWRERRSAREGGHA
jgi:Ca-activated chloride channel family protein